jgi:hypothetical protein
LLALTLLLASGCATVHRGVVAMKIDESTSHVRLNDNEVSVGDVVTLYRISCTHTERIKPTSRYCEERPTARCSGILNQEDVRAENGPTAVS